MTLDSEMLPTWLANSGLPGDMTLAEVAKHDAVRAGVQRAIDMANADVSPAESIRAFTILPGEWTEAGGHLTPKMSIKRSVIVSESAAARAALYRDPVATTNAQPR